MVGRNGDSAKDDKRPQTQDTQQAKKTSGNLKNIFAQAPHFSAWKVRGFFMASRNLENRIPIRQVRSHCFCDKHKPR